MYHPVLILVIIIIVVLLFWWFIVSSSNCDNDCRNGRNGGGGGGGGGGRNTPQNYAVNMTGAQVVPPVITTATGTGSAVLSADRRSLTYNLTVSGLTCELLAASSGFFVGAPGTAGTLVKNVVFTPVVGANTYTATGVWTSTDVTQPLTPALVTSLQAGNVFVQVASGTYDFPGEVRGVVQRLLTA